MSEKKDVEVENADDFDALFDEVRLCDQLLDADVVNEIDVLKLADRLRDAVSDADSVVEMDALLDIVVDKVVE